MKNSLVALQRQAKVQSGSQGGVRDPGEPQVGQLKLQAPISSLQI